MAALESKEEGRALVDGGDDLIDHSLVMGLDRDVEGAITVVIALILRLLCHSGEGYHPEKYPRPCPTTHLILTAPPSETKTSPRPTPPLDAPLDEGHPMNRENNWLYQRDAELFKAIGSDQTQFLRE